MSQADYLGRLGAVCESLSDWPDAAQNWAAAVKLFDGLNRENHLRAPDARAIAERARLAQDRCRRLVSKE